MSTCLAMSDAMWKVFPFFRRGKMGLLNCALFHKTFHSSLFTCTSCSLINTAMPEKNAYYFSHLLDWLFRNALTIITTQCFELNVCFSTSKIIIPNVWHLPFVSLDFPLALTSIASWTDYRALRGHAFYTRLSWGYTIIINGLQT